MAQFDESKHPRDKDGKFTSTGNAILKVENKNSHKLVITSGIFEKPKAKTIYSFSSSDEMNDAITELKILW